MFKGLIKKEVFKLIVRAIFGNIFMLVCMYSFMYFIAFTKIKYVLIGFISMFLGLLCLVGIEQ